MSEYEKKVKKDIYSDVSRDRENYDLLKYPQKMSDTVTWWTDNNKKSRDSEILKNDLDIKKAVPSGGKKVSDIPQQMGSFETKSMGTVMVGFNRFKESSDLGFTVVSEKDRAREGTSKRNRSSSKTCFGANFDGEEKQFKAGAISFRFDKQTEKFEKIGVDDDNDKTANETNMIYNYKKENDVLEKLQIIKKKVFKESRKINEKKEYVKKIKSIIRKYAKKIKNIIRNKSFKEEAKDFSEEKLQKEKKKNSKVIHEINEEKEKVEEIKSEKKEKNKDFSNELVDFTKDLANKRLKTQTESEELKKQKDRISQNKQTDENETENENNEQDENNELPDQEARRGKKLKKKRKKSDWELSQKIILIEELKKILAEVIGEEKAEEIARDLRAKARVKGLSMNEFLKIIENIKKSYNIK